MTSILVNSAAITALQSLRVNRYALDRTQQEISTGRRVSNASDNSSTWSIAESLKSDKQVMLTIRDSLAQANSVLSIAAGAVQQTMSVMNDIKANIAQTIEPNADKAKILTNLKTLGQQITSIITSATFNGVNVLDTSQNNPLKFIASYKNGEGSDSRIDYIEFPLSTLIDKLGGHFGMVEAAQGSNVSAPTDFTAMTATDLSSTTIEDTLTNADKALNDLTTYASIIGVTQARVRQQADLIKGMDEAYSMGISALVDAEMNETSTRLRALQTQHLLGVQSLSIANQNAKMILKLFQ